MSLQEDIYNKLKKAIIRGELNPGEKLYEIEIAKKLNVSRTPVREAFRRLQVDGDLSFAPNKGVFVTKHPPQEIKEIYDIISVLEGYAVELAAQRITAKDLAVLKKYQKQLIKFSSEKKYHQYAEQNYKFHEYLTILSNNATLVKTISTLRSRVYRYRFISVTIPGYLEKYASEHESIMDALKMKDSSLAGKYMKAHVDFVKNILVSFLEEHQKI